MVSGVGSNVDASFQVAVKSVPEILDNIEDFHVNFATGDSMLWKFPDTSDWRSVKFNRHTGYLQLAKNCKTVTVELESNRFSIILKLMVTFPLYWLHEWLATAGLILAIISWHSHSELECYITDIQVSLYLNAGLLFHLFNLYDFVGENLGNAVGQCSKNIAR